MWSYTDARYQPPPPYVPGAEPYEPFALAAVELEAEGLVVLGQVAAGYGVVDLTVGARGRAGGRAAVHRRRRDRPDDVALEAGHVSERRRRRRASGCTRGASGAGRSSPTACTRPGPRWPTPGSTGPTSQLVVGGETVRNGYAGYVAGATFAQALGWNGARVATAYAACATGAQAIDAARARILAGMCDVALVVGADTTPKGFLAPNAGERSDDPDWLRFRLLGMTNPAYFALYARRRMDLYGATVEDFAAVKVKNARHGLANPNARYRKEVTAEEVAASPVVADPLRLLDICATSDGGAAVVLTSDAFARSRGLRRAAAAGGGDGGADVPEHGHRDAQLRHRLDRGGRRRRT